MFVGELRPYQESAVDEMVQRGNRLLAYDQGTGKTVVSIAAVEDLMGEGEVATTLIVVLSSLKLQWAQALAEWTDLRKQWKKVKDRHIRVPAQDQCVLINGSPERRARQYEQIHESQPEYIIATYDNIIDDWQYIRSLDVQCIILDEATQIKTFKAQRTKRIKRLWAPYRFALTGTPIENGKPEEIFSIMQWVDPDVFGPWPQFEDTYIVRNGFGAVQRYRNMHDFHERLSEAMSRKTVTDADVADFMPTTQHRTVTVEMDFPTRRAYRRIADDLAAELRKAGIRGKLDLAAYYAGQRQPDENSAQGRIMARMLAAQMLLDHPQLLARSAKDWEESEKLRQQGVEKANWPGSKYAYEAAASGLLDTVTTAPKLDAAIQEIETILAEDPEHKVIVFSFFRGMADILQQKLSAGSAPFHGHMTATARAAAKDSFARDPKVRLFLASDAGGYGLDLPEASHLINIDFAASAGAQDQRNSRHRRTSSRWPVVHVIDVLVQDTLEERKLAQLKLKRRVASAALDRRGASKRGEIEVDVESLTAHLERTS